MFHWEHFIEHIKRQGTYAAYHFDLIDHRTVEDKGGRILADDVMAADVADRLAQDLFQFRPDLRWKGYSILVSGPEGETVHKAPVEQSI